MIITSYIKIILLIIFAPVFLLFNAIPGKSVFGTWIKNLIAELLIFPLLVIIFVTGSILINLTSKGAYFTPPFMAGINASSFSFLLGMGLLFMTPDLIKTAKQLILPKPLPVPDVGLGVFFGGASAGLTGGIGEVSKWASLGYYVKPLGALMAKATGGLVDPTGQQRGATAPGTNNPCLSVNTFINTPSGPSLITKLKMGDVVWTRDLFGKKRESFILSVVRTSVPRNHMIAKLYLTDGRKLFVSPHHPLIDKRDVADLKKGDHYDGSVVRLIRIMRYNHRYTYDILPSGSTGIYLANDIALGSTLFNRDFKGLRKSLRIAEYLSTSYHYFKKAILVE